MDSLEKLREVHAAGPVKTELAHVSIGLSGLNRNIAVAITNGVGTMWCAYIFAALALISLPAALLSGNIIIIVSWVAQTFLQLVLLSIIIVGQKVSSAITDARAETDHAILGHTIEILAGQNKELATQTEILRSLQGRKENAVKQS